MSSAQEDVIARVLAIATAETSGFTVSDGHKPTLGSKFIAMGDITDYLSEYHAMRGGVKPRQETYDLVLHIVSIKPGDSPTAVRTEVLQAWEQIALAIAADPSMALDPTLVVLPREKDVRIRFDDNTRGWRAEVVGKINVKARRVGT